MYTRGIKMKCDRQLLDELFEVLGFEKECTLDVTGDVKINSLAAKIPPCSIRGVKMVDVDDVVYKFWLLKKHNTLASTCWVMLGGVQHNNGIRDLQSMYGGVLWGDVFLFVYRSNNNNVVPSQRGLFLS